MRLISHPFRLQPNGEVATVVQGGDEANAEQLAVLCLTELGERPLELGFGITDPAFAGFEATQVLAGVDVFGPDVTIENIRVEQASDEVLRVEIDFT